MILYCYVEPHPRALEALSNYAPNAVMVDTSEDDGKYSRVLQEYWDCDEDLIVIEQDIEITAEVIPSFSACPWLWCTYSYQGPPRCGYIYSSLGCARFSAGLMQTVKFREILQDKDKNIEYKSVIWKYLDGHIIRVMNDHYMMPHVHGHIQHHHDYSKDAAMTKYCAELQAGPWRIAHLYLNNADGSRGEFVREVEFEDMAKWQSIRHPDAPKDYYWL